jgi:hypothetical protein
MIDGGLKYWIQLGLTIRESLVRRLESQTFSGPVIQSVFDHSQLFVGDGFHAAFLGDYRAISLKDCLAFKRLRIWYGSSRLRCL